MECLSIRTGCSCTGSDQRPQGLSVRGFRSPTTSHTRALTVSTTQSSPNTQCLKSSRPTMMGTCLPSESSEKGDQKLYLQPTQDIVTSSMSGLAMNQAAEKPPTTPEGIPEKMPFLGSVPFPGSRVGALSPPCALGVPMSQGSNVPVHRGASSRGSNVPREGKPGCVD